MRGFPGSVGSVRRLAAVVALGLLAWSAGYLLLLQHARAHPEPGLAVRQDGTVDAAGLAVRPMVILGTGDASPLVVRPATRREAERAEAGSFDRIAGCQGLMLVGDAAQVNRYGQRATAVYARLGVARTSSFAGDACAFMRRVAPFVVRTP